MFVSLIQGEVSDRGVLRRQWDEWTSELAGADGWLGAVGGVTADGRCVGVFRFSSSGEGRRWSGPAAGGGSPLRRRDSTDVEVLLSGCPPEARFVQVMQATVRDRAAFAAVDEPCVTRFAEVRPDFLGTLHVWDPDGTLTVVDSFTSEAEARAGEGVPMPPDLRTLFDTWMGQLDDIRWYDLPDPWRAAPKR